MIKSKFITAQEMMDRKYEQIIEIPSWHQGETIHVKVRPPSMPGLASLGFIPNLLLTPASNVFKRGNFNPYKGELSNTEEDGVLNDVNEIAHTLVKDVLLEPSYDELEREGISLTDEQVFFIFSEVMQEYQYLSNFIQSDQMPRIISICLSSNARPSDVMGIKDAYLAFCFDEASYFIIDKIKTEERIRPVWEPTLTSSKIKKNAQGNMDLISALQNY